MSDISDLKDKIKSLQEDIKLVQDGCHHPKVVYERCSNTGNYDPSCDSYWVDIRCLCCEKRIHLDSEVEPLYYRTFDKHYGKDLCVSRKEYEVLKKTGVKL